MVHHWAGTGNEVGFVLGTTKNGSSNGSWECVASDDPWQNWNPRNYDRESTRESARESAPKDGDVPEWNGKDMHRTTYFRKVDLWCSTTGVPPAKRALRLLQKLSGEACEKLEHIEVVDLQVEDGVERFKQHVINAYEPIEDYRVGKLMDEFLDEFIRKRGQEIVEFNTAWHRELTTAEKVAGELTGKRNAHLYLKKLRLSQTQKSQVLTGALGQYTVEALQKAALTYFLFSHSLGR